MKKLIIAFTIPIGILATFFLYNSYVPIRYTNDCNDKHIFRYQFGIYKIDTLGKKEVNFEQMGSAEDYFGFDKAPCIDAIYHYEQSLRKKEIDSVNKSLNWKMVKNNLCQNKNGELGFQESMGLGEGNNSVAINYITKFGFNKGKTLKSVIDTATFTSLGSYYYKDKRHIYSYYAMLNGGSFNVETTIDYNTFKVIGDVYAKDKNHIYVERTGILEGVDYKSFTTKMNIGPYAKDKFGYYNWSNRINTLNQDDEYSKEAIKKLNQP